MAHSEDKEGTVAHSMKLASKEFGKRSKLMKEMYDSIMGGLNLNGPEENPLNQDLLPGVDNYILFEGASVDRQGKFSKWDPGPSGSLEVLMLAHFAKNLPCFTIRTTRSHWMTPHKASLSPFMA